MNETAGELALIRSSLPFELSSKTSTEVYCSGLSLTDDSIGCLLFLCIFEKCDTENLVVCRFPEEEAKEIFEKSNRKMNARKIRMVVFILIPEELSILAI